MNRGAEGLGDTVELGATGDIAERRQQRQQQSDGARADAVETLRSGAVAQILTDSFLVCPRNPGECPSDLRAAHARLLVAMGALHPRLGAGSPCMNVSEAEIWDIVGQRLGQYNRHTIFCRGYTTGDHREDSAVRIGHRAFEFAVTVTPSCRHYGIIAACDRWGQSAEQFRLEIYRSGKISLACAGLPSRGQHFDGDPNTWRSDLVTVVLPIGEPTDLRVLRTSDGIFQLYVNDEKQSEIVADVQPVCTGNYDKAFRIGSRLPPAGQGVHDLFQGTIENAVLTIFEA